VTIKLNNVERFMLRAIEAASVNTDALQALGASVVHVEYDSAGGKVLAYFDDGSRAEIRTFHQQPLRRVG
jgi:hypothetical protein